MSISADGSSIVKVCDCACVLHTVSLYGVKENRSSVHSFFIFSMDFSREYSLLAEAPISSNLGQR